ncbi:hypothetical protein [Pseudomonas entomophila]|uniref:hypothetical protein n=1 Tax=Pseudomonas entomophila TaxID=312306 RepID=UPI001F00DC8F|nr:hypothetical protein [Pseudomonas entomophila]MCG8291764.1 hypothetical protein [Pseudomonas entomophila]
MKKTLLTLLLATASLAQVAHSKESVHAGTIDTATVVLFGLGEVSPIPCPEGTYPTPEGLCQPEFDFD